MKTLAVKKDNHWQIVEAETPFRARIAEAKSRKEAVAEAERILATKTEDDLSKALKGLWKKHKTNKRFKVYADLFQSIFKRPLQYFNTPMIYALCGVSSFDVISFDHVLPLSSDHWSMIPGSDPCPVASPTPDSMSTYSSRMNIRDPAL